MIPCQRYHGTDSGIIRLICRLDDLFLFLQLKQRLTSAELINGWVGERVKRLMMEREKRAWLKTVLKESVHTFLSNFSI